MKLSKCTANTKPLRENSVYKTAQRVYIIHDFIF